MQHLHGLVEQFAAARSGQEQLAQTIKRQLGKLKLKFMGAGFDQLSQLAGAMQIAAGRTTSQNTKARILRDGVGSIKFQLELEERLIRQQESVTPERAEGR